MKEPKCRKPHCNNTAEWYGLVGGYSKQCKKHNKEKAAKQRAARRKHPQPYK